MKGCKNEKYAGNAILQKTYKQDIASGRFEAIQERYNKAKKNTDDLIAKINDRKNRNRQIQHFINKVEKLNMTFDSFDENTWLGLADHMTVYSKDRITVTFRCGTEI